MIDQPNEQLDTAKRRERVGKSLLWVLGTACLVGPVLAEIWPSRWQGSWVFVLLVVSLAGAVYGPIWNRERDSWLSPALIVAIFYPISFALATVVGPVAIVVTAITVALGRYSRNPARALRWWGIAWLVTSTVMLGSYGIGLLLMPEPISILLASRSARRRSR